MKKKSSTQKQKTKKTSDINYLCNLAKDLLVQLRIVPAEGFNEFTLRPLIEQYNSGKKYFHGESLAEEIAYAITNGPKDCNTDTPDPYEFLSEYLFNNTSPPMSTYEDVLMLEFRGLQTILETKCQVKFEFDDKKSMKENIQAAQDKLYMSLAEALTSRQK